MQSEQRRQKIKNMLLQSDTPISGNRLAEQFGVTRQVIVKDIGILKASGLNILSTARGYLLQKDMPSAFCREITVCHSKEQIADELRCIVDLGGHIRNTHVDHPIYGNVGEELHIKSRKDIQNFLEKTAQTGCMPLLELTNGVHTHMIAADNIETLDEICAALQQAGYLLDTHPKKDNP